jgi:hypothetical protein
MIWAEHMTFAQTILLALKVAVLIYAFILGYHVFVKWNK